MTLITFAILSNSEQQWNYNVHVKEVGVIAFELYMVNECFIS